ncbi:unnamed protein product [Ambrosiozyma monospora]|uniref:Unnamed protein product n=1 Tax=Ambrosiozyma monospora TaxID=43982 RepID=A0ACB5UAC7_AMBMO|nr:unnamed protein product [Ambrosiozyma monospora]
MHWRRGKSELREMARSMLEKEILLQKDHKSKRITSTSSMQSNKNVNNNNGGNISSSNSSISISHKKSMSFTSRSRQASGSISSVNTAVSELNSSNGNDFQWKELEQRVQKAEVTFTQADRQFTISTYILWRVLIEVVRQTPTSTLMEETGLEEIMYNYLRNIDPYLVSQSLIHSANWNLLAELIGRMSEKSFLSVSDRFIADLEKFPTGYTSNNGGLSEAGLNLLIHGMRYLQFSNSSLERFEEAADFMLSVAKFFYRCENENILISYCDVINQLLLSLAGTLTAEVNHPTWVEAIKIIYMFPFPLKKCSKTIG